MSVLRLEYRRIFQITDVSWIQPQSADEVMDIVFALFRTARSVEHSRNIFNISTVKRQTQYPLLHLQTVAVSNLHQLFERFYATKMSNTHNKNLYSVRYALFSNRFIPLLQTDKFHTCKPGGGHSCSRMVSSFCLL
jgi:hypothetical protein